YVRRLAREQELAARPTPKAPLKGRRTIVHGTSPTSFLGSLLPSLIKVFKNTGGKPSFNISARLLLQTRGGTNALLGEIANSYLIGKTGLISTAGKKNPASILTLSPASDSEQIARAYALATMYIYMQDVSAIVAPDNTLSVDDERTSVGVYLKLDKQLNDVREGRLVNDLRKAFGDEVEYVRLNDRGPAEIVVFNNSLEKLQFARRFGRFYGKGRTQYGIKTANLYTSRSSTVQHDWSSDIAGESIRSEIREL
ncbi:uncharacterized protein METZ01_LOCUS456462, partial [marine metagenome]